MARRRIAQSFESFRVMSSGGEKRKEFVMAKALRCDDVIPGCSYVVRADTEEEVMRKAAEHARLKHNTRRITPEITAMMRAAVREEKSASAA